MVSRLRPERKAQERPLFSLLRSGDAKDTFAGPRLRVIARDHGACWVCGRPGSDKRIHVHQGEPTCIPSGDTVQPLAFNGYTSIFMSKLSLGSHS